MKLKPNKAMEIESPQELIVSEPLIKNPPSLKKITKKEVDNIKSKNKKIQIATIYGKEPIQLIPLSLEGLEKVKQLKEKNKKKPAPVNKTKI